MPAEEDFQELGARLVTTQFKNIPESRDSTLGAALWRPGSPWLRYISELQYVISGLMQLMTGFTTLSEDAPF